MARKVIWLNPYLTETRMVPEGTVLPVSMAEDGGALIIEHEDDLMLCMDSPLDVRDFLKDALSKVEAFIEEHQL